MDLCYVEQEGVEIIEEQMEVKWDVIELRLALKSLRNQFDLVNNGVEVFTGRNIREITCNLVFKTYYFVL